ncbi:hypothetical protein [Labilibaculum euxinus]|uniref:Uncharacterized protein n=1 Tax=Labilibaculum euxinus TaxID=2686357 RepID=A0A7M4D507_9BACT|nr:hypothetical protein [Labilibaculum euxinus]MUP37736.1 hypothetical protein [Labilibaculum euxinus]MVB06941.1 hypothetical protein [Labilibaculum euxinus]
MLISAGSLFINAMPMEGLMVRLGDVMPPTEGLTLPIRKMKPPLTDGGVRFTGIKAPIETGRMNLVDITLKARA